MNIVVTGGSGWIGSRLIKSLSESNRVLSIDKQEPKEQISKVLYELSDVNDSKRAIELFNPDMVFHLAGLANVTTCEDDPSLSFKDNFLSTVNIAEFSNCPVVFTSSAAVYGNSIDVAKPISTYGKHKLMAEDALNRIMRYKSINNFRVLRLFNVYDFESGSSVVKKIVDEIKEEPQNRSFHIHGDGSSTRDFIHIDDVVSVMLKKTRKSVNELDCGGYYFDFTGPEDIGTGHSVSVKELYNAAMGHSDENPPRYIAGAHTDTSNAFEIKHSRSVPHQKIKNIIKRTNILKDIREYIDQLTGGE